MTLTPQELDQRILYETELPLLGHDGRQILPAHALLAYVGPVEGGPGEMHLFDRFVPGEQNPQGEAFWRSDVYLLEVYLKFIKVADTNLAEVEQLAQRRRS